MALPSDNMLLPFFIGMKKKCNSCLFYVFLILIFTLKTLRALFTKLLTPGLTREFCNPLDDWLESTRPTNDPEGYLTRGLNWELKI